MQKFFLVQPSTLEMKATVLLLAAWSLLTQTLIGIERDCGSMACKEQPFLWATVFQCLPSSQRLISALQIH